MLLYCVRWVCCEECSHSQWFATEGEAMEMVEEARALDAIYIELWRFRIPRNKDAVLDALNTAAGNDFGMEGEQERLLALRRADCECDCPDCQGDDTDEVPPKDLN